MTSSDSRALASHTTSRARAGLLGWSNEHTQSEIADYTALVAKHRPRVP